MCRASCPHHIDRIACGALIPSGSYCARCTLGTGWGQGRDRAAQDRFRRAVLARDGFRCTYVDPRTGERCEATQGLQAAHIIPLAHGGTNEAANGETLCRPHHRLTDPKAR